ncbi:MULTISPECIES: hypothetical protein [Nocardia]|uniref:hypothetical protein n=1 Tax=Nocardia TaxID=1817 RepID=UPI0024550B56|nr:MULTISPECIES: hypothetical protein [Nocardia]
MIQIYMKSLHSHEETDEVGADEPYVLVTTVNLASVVSVAGIPVPVPPFEVTRYGFSDVDDEETHQAPGPSRSFWGVNGKPAELTDPDSAIFIVSLMENDDGDPEALRGVVKGVVGGSVLGSLAASRTDKVNALIQDINSAMGTPTGAPNFDDKVGLTELRFTADELRRANAGEQVRRSVKINGDGGRFELTFEAWNVNPFPNWQLLDNNPATVALAADGANLYQLHTTGWIFKYTGTPMTGWQVLDKNPATKNIVAAGGNFYQRHGNGAIFKYTGTPVTGWQILDNNPRTTELVASAVNLFGASAGNLYQRHDNGAIFKSTA